MAETAIKFQRETPEIVRCYVDIKTKTGSTVRRKFPNDVQANIFCAAIYNGFYASHNDYLVAKYTLLVEDLYYEDEEPTPLGSLCDYVAENWDEIIRHERAHDYDRFALLCHFYASIV